MKLIAAFLTDRCALIDGSFSPPFVISWLRQRRPVENSLLFPLLLCFMEDPCACKRSPKLKRPNRSLSLSLLALTSHCVTVSHVCVIYTRRLIWHIHIHLVQEDGRGRGDPVLLDWTEWDQTEESSDELGNDYNLSPLGLLDVLLMATMFASSIHPLMFQYVRLLPSWLLIHFDWRRFNAKLMNAKARKLLLKYHLPPVAPSPPLL